ncbi:MAG TPA: vWA domain-containing protein [Kofleriaceae bacterium]|nr:vWA domain-containing protein [Kofleriaceae bacterium]
MGHAHAAGRSRHRAGGARRGGADRSAAMQGARLDAAKDALRVAVAALDPSDELEIVTFGSDATVIVPLHKLERGKTLDDAIAKIAAGGGTSLLAALTEASTALRRSKLGRKHVIVIARAAVRQPRWPGLLHRGDRRAARRGSRGDRQGVRPLV